MRLSFNRTLDALPQVLKTVAAFCTEHKATSKASYALSFGVEELFTNMVKYNPAGPAAIDLSLETSGPLAVITLEDIQESDFDMLQAPEPPLDRPIAERDPGGLGIYLIKKMVSDVRVTRVANKQSITLTHPLEQN